MVSSVVAAAPGAHDDHEAPARTNEEQQEQPEQQQPVMFCLNIFETLDQAQSSHGIPLQDYAQYHAYCRKRLHRLTHHKEVRTILTHNAKYEPGASSSSSGGNKLRRHAYCPRNVVSSPDLVVSHEYVIWHLFFQAERAWAQACAAQKEDTSATSSSSTGVLKKKKSSNSNGRQHNHVRRRLNKAVKWATQFVQLVSNSGGCHERTIQEAQAYLAWMQANAHLECKHYADAYRHYQTSRRILLHLAKNATQTTTDDAATATNTTTVEKNADAVAHQLVISDLWTRWAESILKPLVRYCLHEARDTLDPAEVLALETAVSSSENSSSGSGSGLTSPKKKTSGSNDGAIRLTFRNQEITLDAYPQLAVLYLKMEEYLFPNAHDGEEEEKNKKQPPLDEAEFLQLLTDLDDATSLTLTEAAKYTRLAAASSSAPGPAVQAKRTELATLQSFFTHSKLQLQRQRQEERVATLSDVAEIVHVYDALLQNAQALADLHTFKSDKHDVQPELQHAANEDDPYWLEAQAHLVRIRAFRCFHLARLYESMPANSSSSAGTTTVAALLQQASLLQQRATEEVAACEMDDVYLDALHDLQKDIQAMTCRIEATRFLELQASTGGTSGGGSSIGKTTDRPLWLRLDDLDAGTGVLADQPPLLIPIPYKPVFYDLAWDHVFENDKGLQALQNYIQEHGESKEEASSSSGGGIFGWFSSK